MDSQGRPPGVLGMWPSRAITFIDNHDTGSTLNHWPYPSRNLGEGYAYILTHPGAGGRAGGQGLCQAGRLVATFSFFCSWDGEPSDVTTCQARRGRAYPHES